MNYENKHRIESLAVNSLRTSNILDIITVELD